MDREPEYDPESVGMPGIVDPDSNAYDEAESVRESDGPATPVMPFDSPQAAGSFGVTGEEAREGTPLDLRLAAELPEVSDADIEEDEGDDGEEYENRTGSEPEEAVGRLGMPEDDDADHGDMSFAEDEGFAGGGLTAEESAMHLTEEPTD